MLFEFFKYHNYKTLYQCHSNIYDFVRMTVELDKYEFLYFRMKLRIQFISIQILKYKICCLFPLSTGKEVPVLIFVLF